MNKPIYLDYNATAPMRPEVLGLVSKVMGDPHNASAVHAFGREGRKYIEEARRHIAKLANTDPAQVIFNSGATEGNNTVLKHFADERILISEIEHPSVYEALPGMEKIKIQPNGTLDLNHLEELLTSGKRAALVSVMMVNNETGVIQPTKEISAIVHKHGALFHCDGVQAAGRIAIDMQAMGIDFLTLSAHKIGGPQGVGALCLGLCGVTPTMLRGGGQEKSARAGTENVAGISGFGKAAQIPLDTDHIQNLRDGLEKGLKDICPDIKIYGANGPRVCNTTLFVAPGLNPQTLLMNFDLEGICLSSGSACSSGNVQTSHVLQAMGASSAETNGALRISLGWNTKESDIDRFIEVWEKVYQRITKKG